MYALSGRVDGNAIVVNENIARYEGCDVVITILDRITDHQFMTTEKQGKAAREKAAKSLAGLWKNHHDELSVEETVRMMRRGRQESRGIAYRE